MRRTALLIGAPTHGLTGVDNDIDAMAEQFARRGFAITRCQGSRATRAGILEGYERLVTDAGPDDAVVVYYSGHGGVAVAPPGLVRRHRSVARLQFIVPTDYDEPTGSDFRGITAAELSVLLARLTSTTPNVTVILDTCHAAHMSRDAGLRVKALRAPAYVDVAEHLGRLTRHGLDVTIRHVLGNRDAVRVVACGPQESAYEYTNSAGRRHGILTESLALALADTGDPAVTWAALVDRVRRRVQELVPRQRPEAEGPSLRRPFQMVSREPSGRPAHSAPGTAAALGAPVAIEWGVVIGGRPHPLPATGTVVHAGDRAYVAVRNRGKATVYVSLLEEDVSSRISVITSLDPSGIPVEAGGECVVGRDELDGRLVGMPLAWPPGADRAGPRPATIAVLVSSAPRDVSLLLTRDGPGGATADGSGGATADGSGAAFGGRSGRRAARVFRDLPASTGDPARYDVHTITFRLDPATRRPPQAHPYGP